MTRLILIGAGDAGKNVITEILENDKMRAKYEIVGILDDDEKKTNLLGYPVLGRIKNAKSIIEEKKASEAIIAIPSADNTVINKIITNLSTLNIKIKIVPGIMEIIEGKVMLGQIRDIEPVDLLGREEIGFDINEIASYYKDKTILVSGAGGSIGSEIIKQLLELPVERVIAMGRGENSIHSLSQSLGTESRFLYIIGDIKDKEKVEHELGKHKPDIVFHSAAHKHVNLMEGYPDEAMKNNVLGTYIFANAAIKYNVKDFVLISTDKAVNPTSVMGASKRMAERIVLSLDNMQKKTRLVFTRFGNVLGSRGSVVPIFQSQIEKGEPITVTDPEVTRYFMSIREASRLVIKAATIHKGKKFVLDMGKPVKIYDLAKKLIEMYGFDRDDIPIIFTGLKKGEKMYEEILTKEEELTKSNYHKLFISNKTEDILDKKGLEEMISRVERAVKSYDNNEIINVIKEYVPEYNNA